MGAARIMRIFREKSSLRKAERDAEGFSAGSRFCSVYAGSVTMAHAHTHTTAAALFNAMIDRELLRDMRYVNTRPLLLMCICRYSLESGCSRCVLHTTA